MIDPKKTTLYNHETVGDGTKPLIPNKVFKELLEAIDSGNIPEFKKCINEYALTEEQEYLAKYKLSNKTS